jgi:hypothetical protein
MRFKDFQKTYTLLKITDEKGLVNKPMNLYKSL